MLDILDSLNKYGQDAIIGATFFTVLTTIAVVLRLSTFLVTKTKFGWSEALLLLAQGCWYAQYGILMHILVVGRRMKSMEDPRLSTFLKGLYFIGDLYFPLVFFTNVSILFLYRRFFPIRTFKKATIALLVAHVFWFIPGFLVEIFICNPPNTMWLHPELIEQKCINYDVYIIIILCIELLLDALVLALPIFCIIDLNVSWARRAELIFIFLLGGFVIITGIIRIIKSIEPTESSMNFVLDLFWLNIHAGAAIICACLPTYRPLIVKSASVLSSYSGKIFSSVADSDAQRSDDAYDESDESRDSSQGKGRNDSYNRRNEYQKFGSDDELQLVAISDGGRAV